MNGSQQAGLPDASINREPLPERRSRLRNMMLSATIILAAGACSNHQEGTAPQTPAPAAPHVVFYAEGKGTTTAAVTMLTETGGTIQKDIALPMHNETTGAPGIESQAFKRGSALSVLLQNKEASGSVTCRIEVDGKIIDEATSSGGYKVVACAGKVP